MKYYSFLLFILYLLNFIKSENISKNFTEMYSNKNSHIKSPLDISMDHLTAYEDKLGYSWFVEGYVIVYNSNLYTSVLCGFTKGEPSDGEKQLFTSIKITSSSAYMGITIDISMGSLRSSDDRFTCYLCYRSLCDGRRYINLKPDSSSTPVSATVLVLVIVITVVLFICCCGSGCYVIYRSRISISSRNGNTPVGNGSNRKPFIPLNSKVVFAIQNDDGSIEYYSANGISPNTTILRRNWNKCSKFDII